MAEEQSGSQEVEAAGKKRRGWLRRRLDSTVATTRLIYAQPRQIGTIAREAAITLWSSRGGGFYGLGYVLTFIVLETRTLFSDVATSETVLGFISQEVTQVFFRMAFESLLNSFLAFLWPLYVLQWLSHWGIVVLLLGWWSYGKWAVPYVAALGVERRERGRKQV
jgi:hypothetical protein